MATKNVNVTFTPVLGIGNVLAAVISYTTYKSILWTVIHGFFGWFYVIYAVLTGVIS